MPSPTENEWSSRYPWLKDVFDESDQLYGQANNYLQNNQYLNDPGNFSNAINPISPINITQDFSPYGRMYPGVGAAANVIGNTVRGAADYGQKYARNLIGDVALPLAQGAANYFTPHPYEENQGIPDALRQFGRQSLTGTVNATGAGLAGLYDTFDPSVSENWDDRINSGANTVDRMTNPKDPNFDPIMKPYTAPKGSLAEDWSKGNETIMQPLSDFGPYLGDTAEEHGASPGWSTAARMAPDTFAALMSIKEMGGEPEAAAEGGARHELKLPKIPSSPLDKLYEHFFPQVPSDSGFDFGGYGEGDLVPAFAGSELAGAGAPIRSGGFRPFEPGERDLFSSPMQAVKINSRNPDTGLESYAKPKNELAAHRPLYTSPPTTEPPSEGIAPLTPAEDAIFKSSIPTALQRINLKSATPDKWAEAFKNAKVDDGELGFTGIKALLASKEGQPVSRQEIVDAYTQKNARMEQFTKGENVSSMVPQAAVQARSEARDASMAADSASRAYMDEIVGARENANPITLSALRTAILDNEPEDVSYYTKQLLGEGVSQPQLNKLTALAEKYRQAKSDFAAKSYEYERVGRLPGGTREPDFGGDYKLGGGISNSSIQQMMPMDLFPNQNGLYPSSHFSALSSSAPDLMYGQHMRFGQHPVMSDETFFDEQGNEMRPTMRYMDEGQADASQRLSPTSTYHGMGGLRRNPTRSDIEAAGRASSTFDKFDPEARDYANQYENANNLMRQDFSSPDYHLSSGDFINTVRPILQKWKTEENHIPESPLHKIYGSQDFNDTTVSAALVRDRIRQHLASGQPLPPNNRYEMIDDDAMGRLRKYLAAREPADKFGVAAGSRSAIADKAKAEAEKLLFGGNSDWAMHEDMPFLHFEKPVLKKLKPEERATMTPDEIAAKEQEFADNFERATAASKAANMYDPKDDMGRTERVNAQMGAMLDAAIQAGDEYTGITTHRGFMESYHYGHVDPDAETINRFPPPTSSAGAQDSIFLDVSNGEYRSSRTGDLVDPDNYPPEFISQVDDNAASYDDWSEEARNRYAESAADDFYNNISENLEWGDGEDYHDSESAARDAAGSRYDDDNPRPDRDEFDDAEVYDEAVDDWESARDDFIDSNVSENTQLFDEDGNHYDTWDEARDGADEHGREMARNADDYDLGHAYMPWEDFAARDIHAVDYTPPRNEFVGPPPNPKARMGPIRDVDRSEVKQWDDYTKKTWGAAETYYRDETTLANQKRFLRGLGLTDAEIAEAMVDVDIGVGGGMSDIGKNLAPGRKHRVRAIKITDAVKDAWNSPERAGGLFGRQPASQQNRAQMKKAALEQLPTERMFDKVDQTKQPVPVSKPNAGKIKSAFSKGNLSYEEARQQLIEAGVPEDRIDGMLRR